MFQLNGVFSEVRPEDQSVPGSPPRIYAEALPSRSVVDSAVSELLAFVGERGANGRHLGVTTPAMTLDHSDGDVRNFIATMFDIAAARDIAVSFHIDDSMFWETNAEVAFHPANVEWTDWGGTPNVGRTIDWGGFPIKLAPQLCFNSVAVISMVERRAALIGAAVVAGIAGLEQVGKKHLFAGIIAGWETMLGNEYGTNKSTGYCAMTNLGYSAANPPNDTIALREDVVGSFIALWADGMAAQGVSRDMIFAHLAVFPKEIYDMIAPGDPSLPSTYSEIAHFAPPRVGFSDSFQPGYSTYLFPGVLSQLENELDAHSPRPWASSEGSPFSPGPVPPGFDGSETDPEGYLAALLNRGAVLINLFGFFSVGDENPFEITATTEKARSAYRAFLRGEPLQEPAAL